jgi:hypothetical protein
MSTGVKVDESTDKGDSHQETAGITSDMKGKQELGTTNKGANGMLDPIRLQGRYMRHNGQCGAIDKRGE